MHKLNFIHLLRPTASNCFICTSDCWYLIPDYGVSGLFQGVVTKFVQSVSLFCMMFIPLLKRKLKLCFIA
jgi:hypothetical protein